MGRNYNEFLSLKCSQKRLQNAGKISKNHQTCAETGPYGSVWADICAEWLPQALGSLWNASRALKRPKFGFAGPRALEPPLAPGALFALCGLCPIHLITRCRS